MVVRALPDDIRRMQPTPNPRRTRPSHHVSDPLRRCPRVRPTASTPRRAQLSVRTRGRGTRRVYPQEDELSESDMGLDAGHGRSPGGMGRLFPDASLPTGDGHSLSLDSYRSRRALVIFMLGPGPVAAPVVQLLARLAEAHDAIAAEDGQVLVVIADARARWYERRVSEDFCESNELGRVEADL